VVFSDVLAIGMVFIIIRKVMGVGRWLWMFVIGWYYLSLENDFGNVLEDE
jgi:hypothetical protein